METAPPTPGLAQDALTRDAFARRLETEGLIVLPERTFALDPDEADLLSPDLSDGRAKNISRGPNGSLRGAAPGATNDGRVEALLSRYAEWSKALLLELCPGYDGALESGRTSLRNRSAAEPALSPRKDDTRLHVDAFPSQPTGGRRILRVFTNVNPHGEARLWRVGEPFANHARRWAPQVRRPWPGEAFALRRLGITRATRTPYDAVMLGVHDAAKLDDDYQSSAPRREVAFPAGSSWLVYTDSTVHAAIAGRHALEQTFYLPLCAMAAPQASPARILEAMLGQRLC